MRRKTKTVQCATCGADITVPADDADKLHFCGTTKEYPCILEYWSRLHMKYGTKK